MAIPKKKPVEQDELYKAPVITRDPQSRTVQIGGKVDLRVSATGLPTPSYQWYFNGQKIVGATRNMYMIPRFQRNNAGQYTCEAKNIAGVTQSRMATVSIKDITKSLDLAITITASPKAPTAGKMQRIFIESPSPKALIGATFQWHFNESKISGATGPELLLSEFKEKYSGTYFVVANLGEKNVQSNALELSLAAAPTIAPQTMEAAAEDESFFSFSDEEEPAPTKPNKQKAKLELLLQKVSKLDFTHAPAATTAVHVKAASDLSPHDFLRELSARFKPEIKKAA